MQLDIHEARLEPAAAASAPVVGPLQLRIPGCPWRSDLLPHSQHSWLLSTRHRQQQGGGRCFTELACGFAPIPGVTGPHSRHKPASQALGDAVKDHALEHQGSRNRKSPLSARLWCRERRGLILLTSSAAGVPQFAQRLSVKASIKKPARWRAMAIWRRLSKSCYGLGSQGRWRSSFLVCASSFEQGPYIPGDR